MLFIAVLRQTIKCFEIMNKFGVAKHQQIVNQLNRFCCSNFIMIASDWLIFSFFFLCLLIELAQIARNKSIWIYLNIVIFFSFYKYFCVHKADVCEGMTGKNIASNAKHNTFLK